MVAEGHTHPAVPCSRFPTRPGPTIQPVTGSFQGPIPGVPLFLGTPSGPFAHLTCPGEIPPHLHEAPELHQEKGPQGVTEKTLSTPPV